MDADDSYALSFSLRLPVPREPVNIGSCVATPVSDLGKNMAVT